MKVPILQKDSPILREKTREVPLDEITSPAVKQAIENMKDSMHGESDAVAIAAPQIGSNLRIFVMSGRARLIIKNEERRKAGEAELDLKKTPLPPDEVYINPVLSKLSKAKRKMEEGCLSVRYLYGKVLRSTKATVDAYDENGNKFQKGGSGLIAQIYQHETDHLNGTLFIDKAEDLTELNEEERNEWKKRNRSDK